MKERENLQHSLLALTVLGILLIVLSFSIYGPPKNYSDFGVLFSIIAAFATIGTAISVNLFSLKAMEYNAKVQSHLANQIPLNKIIKEFEEYVDNIKNEFEKCYDVFMSYGTTPQMQLENYGDKIFKTVVIPSKPEPLHVSFHVFDYCYGFYNSCFLMISIYIYNSKLEYIKDSFGIYNPSCTEVIDKFISELISSHEILCNNEFTGNISDRESCSIIIPSKNSFLTHLNRLSYNAVVDLKKKINNVTV